MCEPLLAERGDGALSRGTGRKALCVQDERGKRRRCLPAGPFDRSLEVTALLGHRVPAHEHAEIPRVLATLSHRAAHMSSTRNGRRRRPFDGQVDGQRWHTGVDRIAFTTLIRCFVSTPNGIRTRVTALKGPRPRPLDDGGLVMKCTADLGF